MNDTDPVLTVLQRRPEPMLDDDGFSRRVLDALPRARFRMAVARRWVLGTGAVTGGLATLLLAPPVEQAMGTEPWLAPVITPVISTAFLTLLACCAAWAFVSADYRGSVGS